MHRRTCPYLFFAIGLALWAIAFVPTAITLLHLSAYIEGGGDPTVNPWSELPSQRAVKFCEVAGAACIAIGVVRLLLARARGRLTS